jgi:hypothetical protein
MLINNQSDFSDAKFWNFKRKQDLTYSRYSRKNKSWKQTVCNYLIDKKIVVANKYGKQPEQILKNN